MWLAPPSRHQLREGPGGPPPEVPGAPKPLHEPASTGERTEPPLRCTTCLADITRPDAAIEINGAHSHTFLNPAGQVFRIRCFANAPGALPSGEESDYWTWFAGHRWQACLCRSCCEHLGWRFSGAGAEFYGLIHERIC